MITNTFKLQENHRLSKHKEIKTRKSDRSLARVDVQTDSGSRRWVFASAPQTKRSQTDRRTQKKNLENPCLTKGHKKKSPANRHNNKKSRKEQSKLHEPVSHLDDRNRKFERRFGIKKEREEETNQKCVRRIKSGEINSNNKFAGLLLQQPPRDYGSRKKLLFSSSHQRVKRESNPQRKREETKGNKKIMPLFRHTYDPSRNEETMGQGSSRGVAGR